MASENKTLEVRVAKVSGDVVFGYGIVSEEKTETGSFEKYVDLQGDWIPEHIALDAAKRFMLGARVAKAMHKGEPIGTIDFCLPLTHDVAKQLGIRDYDKTGLIIGMRPNAEVLAKFVSGEYTGFSLGGSITRRDREVDNA